MYTSTARSLLLKFICFTVLQRPWMLLYTVFHNTFWARQHSNLRKNFAHFYPGFPSQAQLTSCSAHFLITQVIVKLNLEFSPPLHFFKFFTLVTLLAAISITRGFFSPTEIQMNKWKVFRAVEWFCNVCIRLRLVINVEIEIVPCALFEKRIIL